MVEDLHLVLGTGIGVAAGVDTVEADTRGRAVKLSVEALILTEQTSSILLAPTLLQRAGLSQSWTS